METSQILVTPFKQAMVRIAGYEVLSICMANGNIGAGVRMICDLLGVDRPTQIHKLQSDPAFRDSLVLAKVEIAGQQRVVHFIIAEFIPLWLKEIHPSKVAPEARETLAEFQRVAVQTLRAFFFPESKAQQQSTPPKEPTPTPLPPQDEAALSLPETLQAVGIYLEARLAGMEQENQELKMRLTDVEQENQRLQAMLTARDRQQMDVVAWRAEVQHQMQLQQGEIEVLWSVALGSASGGDGALNAERQQALQLLLHYHQRVTGQPLAAIRRELLMVIGAASLDHLRESDWKQIVNWFRQQRA